jgi:hypothetical protein
MSDMLVPVERVAEGLWQTINGIDDEGIAAHYAWVGLPEEEKEQWRARARAAIADWKQTNDYA